MKAKSDFDQFMTVRLYFQSLLVGSFKGGFNRD